MNWESQALRGGGDRGVDGVTGNWRARNYNFRIRAVARVKSIRGLEETSRRGKWEYLSQGLE